MSPRSRRRLRAHCAVWNYPLHQLIGKLAQHCWQVVPYGGETRRTEETPLQDHDPGEIIHKVGLPAGVFNLLFGTGETTLGSALAEAIGMWIWCRLPALAKWAGK